MIAGSSAGTFHAAIPTVVGVAAVGVIVAVRQVVLLVVRDQIVQREAIVAGHEVDAVIRLARAGQIEVGTSQQARRQRRSHSGVTLHELANVVAKHAVPLRPASPGRQRAHLVKPGCIPGLGNQLGIGQHRIVGQALQQRRILQHASILPAPQHRCQVEAESVDMHLHHPITQAIDDEVAHHRIVGVHRVAAAGVVHVLAANGIENVVGRIIDAAERPGWTLLVALSRVVEHHVDDHFDAGLVKGANHLLEFLDLLAVCRAWRNRLRWARRRRSADNPTGSPAARR